MYKKQSKRLKANADDLKISDFDTLTRKRQDYEQLESLLDELILTQSKRRCSISLSIFGVMTRAPSIPAIPWPELRAALIISAAAFAIAVILPVAGFDVSALALAAASSAAFAWAASNEPINEDVGNEAAKGREPSRVDENALLGRTGEPERERERDRHWERHRSLKQLLDSWHLVFKLPVSRMSMSFSGITDNSMTFSRPKFDILKTCTNGNFYIIRYMVPLMSPEIINIALYLHLNGLYASQESSKND
ncbi:hypothetical protein KSF78_0003301 [Schistosoma japonicum]|nr:hypothetical protein KSF78_0003301 [Schistosoma japonicum]